MTGSAVRALGSSSSVLRIGSETDADAGGSGAAGGAGVGWTGFVGVTTGTDVGSATGWAISDGTVVTSRAPVLRVGSTIATGSGTGTSTA